MYRPVSIIPGAAFSALSLPISGSVSLSHTHSLAHTCSAPLPASDGSIQTERGFLWKQAGMEQGEGEEGEGKGAVGWGSRDLRRGVCVLMLQSKLDVAAVGRRQTWDHQRKHIHTHTPLPDWCLPVGCQHTHTHTPKNIWASRPSTCKSATLLIPWEHNFPTVTRDLGRSLRPTDTLISSRVGFHRPQMYSKWVEKVEPHLPASLAPWALRRGSWEV